MIEPIEGTEVTLDAYASYLSATHIENLGGHYREDVSNDTAVNLVAVVPSDYVQSTGQSLKPLPVKSAAS